MATSEITIHHSSDTDDLFMMYGFEMGAVEAPGLEIHRQPSDIEGLNQKAREGKLDVTAASVHAYAYLADDYVISSTGASFGGNGYGPKLVAKPGCTLAPSGMRIGIPGEMTSAALALRLYLAQKGISATLTAYFFEDLPKLVLDGEIDLGLLIHEGQLTHVHQGLETRVDLGKWWWDEYQEPLPLGIVVVHRRLGTDIAERLVKAMRESIQYALANRRAAIEYALSFGRGMTIDEADRYIDMYVNDLTVDFGDVGARSIKRFLELGNTRGVLHQYPQITIV